MINDSNYNLLGKYPGNTYPNNVQINKTSSILFDGNGNSIDNLNTTSSIAISSSYVSGSVIGNGITNIVLLTQSQYNAITPISTILYIVQI